MKKKCIVLPVVSVIVVSTLYLLLLRFPYPLFEHVERINNLRIYYHHDRSGKINEVARNAFSLISASSLYRDKDEYSVCLTDTVAEYTLYTLKFRQSGGFYNVAGNCFIRPSDIGKNRVITHRGVLTDGSRPLHYYIAHEVTHGMTCNRYGIIEYFKIPEWIREGVAESTARENPDFKTLIIMNRAHSAEFDKHGSYLRYKLRVDYLLNVRKMSVPEILKYRVNSNELDHEIQEYANHSGI